MKKTIFTGFAVATLIIAAAACQKAEFEGGNAPGGSSENLVPMTITASLEAGTKAALQEGGKVFWESGDAMTVMAVDAEGTMSASYEFTTTGEGEKAEFTGLVGEETAGLSAGWYAVYPNNDPTLYPYVYITNTSSGVPTSHIYWQHTISSGNMSMFLPSLQTAKSVGSSSINAISAGIVDEENELLMKNVGGLVEIELPFDDIESVLLYGNSGEMLTGTVTFAFSETGEPVVSSVDGGNVIRMVPSTGSSFTTGKYYINVPPVTFASGLSLILTKTDNTYAVLRSSMTFDVERSRISHFPSLPENLTFGGKVLKIISHRDDGEYKSGINNLNPGVANKLDIATRHAKGFVWDDKTYGYFLYGTKRVGRNTSSGWGLIWGGAAGDYMELPAVENYALSKVMLISGQASSTLGHPVITNAPAEGTASAVSGCAPWNVALKPQGISYLWSFAGESNTAYRISTTTTTTTTEYCSVQQVYLFYADATDGSSVNPLVTSVESSPIVDYTNKKVTFKGSFSAVDYSSVSQFTCGVDYKLATEADWTEAVAQTATSLEFSLPEISFSSHAEYVYRPWVRFVKKDGQTKTVYGDEGVIDLSKIVLSLVFDDSYWDRTPEGENANFLVREWKWKTNQNTYTIWNNNEKDTHSYIFKYNGVDYPFNFWSFAGLDKYDADGNIIYAVDEDGNYVLDDKGNNVPAVYGDGATPTLHAYSDGKVTRGLCLSYYGDIAHAWMQLPGVENFRLASITGDLYNSFTIEINDAVDTTSENTNILGTPIGNKVGSQTGKLAMDMTFENSRPGVRYYFCSIGKRATIRNMTLTYEYAGE